MASGSYSLKSLRLGERHSGFSFYYGKAIWPHNEEGLENLARYIIRASFSQERMTYVAANESSDGMSKVIYQSNEFRKNWARLIQKIYHVDPLLCPKCLGSMKIISLTEDSEIVKKILKHLNLWDVKRKPLPRANGPPNGALILYNEPLSPSADDYLIDADRTTLRLSTGYPMETYL